MVFWVTFLVRQWRLSPSSLCFLYQQFSLLYSPLCKEDTGLHLGWGSKVSEEHQFGFSSPFTSDFFFSEYFQFLLLAAMLICILLSCWLHGKQGPLAACVTVVLGSSALWGQRSLDKGTPPSTSPHGNLGGRGWLRGQDNQNHSERSVLCYNCKTYLSSQIAFELYCLQTCKSAFREGK